jgi:23S rRNA (adenine2503-C2)-methyltransferase
VQNILDKTLHELQKELKPSYRAKQVFTWLHKKLTFNFDDMTDLPIDLRKELKEKYSIKTLRIEHIASSKDGTKKYLFGLGDGNRIESVLLKDETGRKTVCISTQAGCPLNCAYCATGQMGFKRNLAPSEIIGQVYLIAEKNPDISNLVFMGMGEPFLNYDNVLESIRILTSNDGANFGQRKITISTCGIPEGIRKFADEKLQVRLAVSLNSANDKVRSRLMPVNRKYPLDLLHEAISHYQKKTGRRITLEYVMLDGVNDRHEDLKDLRKFCEGLDVHINLIPFNPFDETQGKPFDETQGKPFGKQFRPSKLETIHHFLNGLAAAKINAVMRRSKGTDILAACGQLAGKSPLS